MVRDPKMGLIISNTFKNDFKYRLFSSYVKKPYPSKNAIHTENWEHQNGYFTYNHAKKFFFATAMSYKQFLKCNF